MPIAGQLNESQQADNEGAALQLGNAGRQAISANQFVYFAAFDGTNNDKDNLSLTGGAFSAPDAQQTNAAQLFGQAAAMRGNDTNPEVGSFRGVGSDRRFDRHTNAFRVRVFELGHPFCLCCCAIVSDRYRPANALRRPLPHSRRIDMSRTMTSVDHTASLAVETGVAPDRLNSRAVRPGCFGW